MGGITLIPVLIAAVNPLLAGRGTAYIAGGMAGVIALPLLLFQPLLAARLLPGVGMQLSRRLHHWVGSTLVGLVAVHVTGLYIASPMDALDALLLVSPTPFSVYGVIAMWTVAATCVLVLLRRKIPLRPRNWSFLHNSLGAVIAVATVIHALMIDGAMGPASKAILCGAVLVCVGIVVIGQRIILPIIKSL